MSRELEDLDREILNSLWLKVVLIAIAFICVILVIWYALLTMPRMEIYDSHTPFVESEV